MLINEWLIFLGAVNFSMFIYQWLGLYVVVLYICLAQKPTPKAMP